MLFRLVVWCQSYSPIGEVATAAGLFIRIVTFYLYERDWLSTSCLIILPIGRSNEALPIGLFIHLLDRQHTNVSTCFDSSVHRHLLVLST